MEFSFRDAGKQELRLFYTPLLAVLLDDDLLYSSTMSIEGSVTSENIGSSSNFIFQ